MKVTCILTSFNRPNWVRHALGSLAGQTHPDVEVLLFDDSSVFDIEPVAREFRFRSIRVFKNQVSPEDRRSQNRLGINCNRGLHEATGDLVSYLCDDDYYHPGWFKDAVAYFSRPENAGKKVAYGILTYSRSAEMVYPSSGHQLFRDGVLSAPSCAVDHNQVIHRRLEPPLLWPEKGAIGAPDAVYFTKLAKAGHLFYPIRSHAVVKRLHSKSLQKTHAELGTSEGESIREGRA